MNRNRICMRVAVINNLELPSDSEFIVSRNETSPGKESREQSHNNTRGWTEWTWMLREVTVERVCDGTSRASFSSTR